MKAGLDTGFILKLYLKEEKIIALWENFLEEKVELVTSLLCAYEFFKVLGSRGEGFGKLERFWQIFSAGVKIVKVDEELIKQGAKFEIGHRLGAFDSLILTSFLREGCDKVYTTDMKWKQKVKEVKVMVV